MTAVRLIAGCMAVGILLFPCQALSRPRGQDHHAQVSVNPLYFYCEYDDGSEHRKIEVPLEISSQMLKGRLDQRVEMPAPFSPVRLLQYLPLAAFEQKIVPERSGRGKPAVRLSIDGPKLSYQRCLIVDNPVRDRMYSLIGSWRYMAVKDRKQRDEWFGQFENELTREPRLQVTRSGGEAVELPVLKGVEQSLDEEGCSIRVLEFYPNFARDYTTGEPVNQSEKRLNPAVHVEITRGGEKEKRWVFTRFPDFKKDRSEGLPYQITLDCPVETGNGKPNFVIVTVGGSSHEVWLQYKGTTASKPLAMGEKIEIPDCRYTFHLAEFESSGRLVEEYRPTEDRKIGVTALQIEAVDAEGMKIPLWLALGKKHTISTANGPLTVMFGPRQSGIPEGHPKLH